MDLFGPPVDALDLLSYILLIGRGILLFGGLIGLFFGSRLGSGITIGLSIPLLLFGFIMRNLL